MPHGVLKLRVYWQECDHQLETSIMFNPSLHVSLRVVVSACTDLRTRHVWRPSRMSFRPDGFQCCNDLWSPLACGHSNSATRTGLSLHREAWQLVSFVSLRSWKCPADVSSPSTRHMHVSQRQFRGPCHMALCTHETNTRAHVRK